MVVEDFDNGHTKVRMEDYAVNWDNLHPSKFDFTDQQDCRRKFLQFWLKIENFG